MNFTSQICTTREQSERLLALDIRVKTADCHVIDTIEGPHQRLGFDIARYAVYGEEGNYQPAWSLHRLIEMYGSAEPLLNKSADNMYRAMIDAIAKAIKNGTFNKEYRL